MGPAKSDLTWKVLLSFPTITVLWKIGPSIQSTVSIFRWTIIARERVVAVFSSFFNALLKNYDQKSEKNIFPFQPPSQNKKKTGASNDSRKMKKTMEANRHLD